jgi:riboflavin synthase alpha subunit
LQDFLENDLELELDSDQVNLEVDMLARYVARQLAFAESNTP